jgi:hypothetical protein
MAVLSQRSLTIRPSPAIPGGFPARHGLLAGAALERAGRRARRAHRADGLTFHSLFQLPRQRRDGREEGDQASARPSMPRSRRDLRLTVVRSHTRSILREPGVSGRQDALAQARQKGLGCRIS